MPSPTLHLPKPSEHYWDIAILVTSGIILLLTLFCLMEGVTTVFMHLYYIPIILLAYHYHKKGVALSVLLSLAYLAMVVYFEFTKSLEILGAVLRVFSFILIAVVVSFLSSNLQTRNQEYQRLSEFNESIISNANVWLSVLDGKGTILVWNKAAEDISGFAADEVIGKNTIWKQLYPDRDYRVKTTHTIMSIIHEKRFFENFVSVITAKNGERKTIAWNTRAIPGGAGTPDHFVVIGIDISRRKRAEDDLRAAYEKLAAQEHQLRQQIDELKNSECALRESEEEHRNILRTAMDGFFIVDPTGTITDCNDAFCTITGFSREDLLSLSIADFEAKESKEDITRHMDAIIRRGFDRFESRYRCKDGKTIDVEVCVVYSQTHGGHFIVFHRDITERRRAENALQQATKKLNLLNQITFSDISEAVYVISGYIDLEKEMTTDPEMQKYLDTQMRLVRDIERWIVTARSYQALGLNPPAWQNISQTFVYAISHLDFLHITRTIAVDRRLECFADPTLENVFYILADNVARHGKTATEVTLRYTETEESLTLFFEDNGVGIPPEDKETIFRRRHDRRNGMGLFLVREILSITGITITETGDFGKGARFEIVIPKGGYRFSGALVEEPTPAVRTGA